MRARLWAFVPILLAAHVGARAAPDPVSLGSWTTQSADAPKSFANGTCAVDASGRLHIAYGGDRLYYARQDATGWRMETADPAPLTGDGASLALDGDGHAHIAYRDVVRGALKYATNASGAWVSVTVTTARVETSWSLAVDPAGSARIAIAGSYDVKIAVSTPTGWSIGPVEAQAIAENCSLAIDRDGVSHVAYTSRAGDGPPRLRHAWAPAGGWTIETIDDDVGDRYPAYPAPIAVDATGAVHIAYASRRSADVGSSPNGLVHATNAGGVWTRRRVTVETPWYWIALALDAIGHAHVAYETDGSSVSLGYATNASGEWRSEVAHVDSRSPCIAMSASGEVHMTAVGGVDRTALRHLSGGFGAWSAEDVDRSAGAGEGNALALDEQGNAHIAHFMEDDLVYTSDKDGAWTSERVDDRGWARGERASIALDASGHAHLAYIWSTREMGHEVRYATNTAGAWIVEVVARSPQPIDAVRFRITGGRPVSIAIDPSGTPHVAYTHFRRKVHEADSLWCARRSVDGWTAEKVGETRDVPSLALALDASGSAHLAYNEHGSRRVRYATNASGAWSVRTVDRLRFRASSATLALDGEGSPHVFYERPLWRDREGFIHSRLRHATNVSGRWARRDIPGTTDWSEATATVDRDGRAHVAGVMCRSEHGCSIVYATDVTGQWRTFVVDQGSGLIGFASTDPRPTFDKDFHALPTRFRAREDGGDAIVQIARSGKLSFCNEPAIALDGTGRARFAYGDRTMGDLKFAAPYENASGAGDEAASWFVHPTASSTELSGEVGWAFEDTGARAFRIPVTDDHRAHRDRELTVELFGYDSVAYDGTSNLATLTIKDAGRR